MQGKSRLDGGDQCEPSFSVLYNQNLKVGRVQTPTLAMIVDRNQKVREFVKERYYVAHLTFGEFDAVSEHFQKKEEADKVASGL